MADAPFRLTPATLDVLEALLATDSGTYGYEITVSTGRKNGVVNPILRRMEQHGWIVGWWETDAQRETGSRRRFYRVAPAFTDTVRAVLSARGRDFGQGDATSLLVGSCRETISMRGPATPGPACCCRYCGVIVHAPSATIVTTAASAPTATVPS